MKYKKCKVEIDLGEFWARDYPFDGQITSLSNTPSFPCFGGFAWKNGTVKLDTPWERLNNVVDGPDDSSRLQVCDWVLRKEDQ